MRSWLDFALAQVPDLYALLLRRQRVVNLEKLDFLALVRRGDVVIDAGANLGTYTLLFSHLVGRRGRVHAFEPAPPTFTALSRRLAREARFANVVPNRRALAATAGDVDLYVPGSDHGQAAIVRHHAGSWTEARELRTFRCEAVTVDGYLAARGEGPPDFIKCDVEGAELRVLEGATATLRRRPPLLHLEVNPTWSRDVGYAPSDLVRFLVSHGYSRFYLADDLACRALLDPLRELASFQGSANLICGVPELHDARLRRLPLARGADATGLTGASGGAGTPGAAGPEPAA
jgi:FkbM family methyltransferase